VYTKIKQIIEKNIKWKYNID